MKKRDDFKIRNIILLISGLLILIFLGIILYNRWNKVISPMTFVEAKKIYNDDKISLTSLCKKTTSRCEKPAGIHPCCVDHLTVMLEKLSQILGSKLFILFGTALAWKRYNGKHMIPHDDDLDTGILAEHEYLLEKAKPLLEKEGFVLTLNEGDENGEGDDPSRSSDNSSKIKYPPYRYYDMTYSKLNSLHVDIALLTPSHLIDNTPVLIDAPQKWADTVSKMSIEEVKKYKTWIIPRDLILPVKSTVYLDVKTYRPNNIDKYLEYTYGKNYIVPYNRDKNVGSIIPVGRLIKTIPCTSNSYIGLAPILIINLDVDVERLHHLLVQCKDEKLYAYKKGNCCSDVLSKETESRFCFNEKIYPVVLVPGEKKCFLSHEMCWKAAAIQVLPSLIVEDDISFPFGINRILKRITDDISYIINNGIAPKAVVVRLGLGRFYGKKHFNSIKSTCLATTTFYTGTWAYIVTPEAAKMLLNVSKNNNLNFPVDHFVNPPGIKNDYTIYNQHLSHSEYMFLEADPSELKPINNRYKLNVDKKRIQIIQELSSEFNSSSSSR